MRRSVTQRTDSGQMEGNGSRKATPGERCRRELMEAVGEASLGFSGYCRLVALAGQLRVLQGHLDKFRARIQELFKQHPDHRLFDSLPGIGEKLAPRLLAELGDDRERFGSPEALQCYAGTAPVSFQSGQFHKARFRRACQKILRQTVHHWANLSRIKSPWAEAYYQKKREQGQSHACALRCLGQRWLKILWKMRQSETLYDAELHQANQLKHGSWVFGLLTPKPA